MKIKNLLLVTSVFLTVISMTACKNNTGKSTDNQQRSTALNVAVVDTIPNTLTPEEVKEGWHLLFDGKSVDQWRGYCQDSFPSHGWDVVNGTLHCIGSGRGEAGSGGDIITRKKYKNFELSLEWKISEGGNSGIFYLARERCGTDAKPIYESAPEMQILDNERHVDAKLGKDGNRQAGSLYDLIPAKPQNAKPAGEWNQVKITVYRGTVVHWMNGANVLEYHLWTPEWKKMVANSKFKDWNDFVNTAEEGYIGLQDHGDDVWFRNIKIKLYD